MGGGMIVTSIDQTDKSRTKVLFNALGDADNIRDYLNKELEIVDYVCETTEFLNEDTGELEPAVRTVLITVDDEALMCHSATVLRDLRRLIHLNGEPCTWEAPMKVVITEKNAGKNRFFKMRMA